MCTYDNARRDPRTLLSYPGVGSIASAVPHFKTRAKPQNTHRKTAAPLYYSLNASCDVPYGLPYAYVGGNLVCFIELRVFLNPE